MSDAKKIVSEVSAEDIDKLVRIGSFTHELEESVRGHIHQELQSWFFFRKLAGECARANVALHGFSMYATASILFCLAIDQEPFTARLWERSAAECFADAHWLEKYLIQRGGRSNPTDISAPKIGISDSPIEPVAPVREALRVEREILEDLERLLSLASKAGDNSPEDIIETRFLRKETRHVKDLGDLLQQVVRVSKQPGHGLYQLDKELRRHKGRIPWGDANDPDIVNLAIQEATTSLQQGL